jgi:hypothetical protein
MRCPNCDRHMSAWSFPEPYDEMPAWRCPDCDLVLGEDGAEEIRGRQQMRDEEDEDERE